MNWIFPPPRLLPKCLNHLKKSNGVGLILTPEWRATDFYPLFESDVLRPYLKKFMRFSGPNMFKSGSDKSSFFGPRFNAAINVWMYDFTFVQV